MNDYKEVILFDDGVENVYFRDVEGYTKTLCFGKDHISCHYFTECR